MKLTKNNLRTMVKQVINESKVLEFPPPPDEESVASAQDALDKDEDIIEFFEDNEVDGDGEMITEDDIEEGFLPSIGNVVGRMAGTATGIPLGGTVGSMIGGAIEGSEEDAQEPAQPEGELPSEDKELSLQEIVQQEIAKALKK